MGLMINDMALLEESCLSIQKAVCSDKNKKTNEIR
jgi:hypothetical protein